MKTTLSLSCLGLLVLLGAVTGCGHTSLKSSTSLNHSRVPRELAAEFEYERPHALVVTEQELEKRDDYTVRRILMPSLTEDRSTNRTITMDYYAPVSPAKKPAILILPMLGGGYDLEKYFAKYFARQGLAAVIVHREKRLKSQETLSGLNVMLKQTVLDNKQAIDWIESRPELDATQVGVFGISMGGIKGALLTPLEERVKASVLCLVGGDLPYILTHTTEKGLVKRREEYLSKENITLGQLHERLRQAITCDPIRFAPYVDPSKVLLVLGTLDTVVPYKTGQALREKMGNPETITVPSGHMTAVVFIPYIESQALQFYRERLKDNSSPKSLQPMVTNAGR